MPRLLSFSLTPCFDSFFPFPLLARWLTAMVDSGNDSGNDSGKGTFFRNKWALPLDARGISGSGSS